jgi:ribonuclease-3
LLRLRRWARAARERLRRLRRLLPPRFRPSALDGQSEDEATAVRRQQIEAFVGVPVGDVELYERALRHRSVLRGQPDSHLQSNERLEFLGDAVLGLVVCDDLYRRHDDLLEGEMTKIKSTVVSRQTCAEIASEMGVCDLLALGKALSEPNALPQSVAAAVFESIIGAIYLDGGLDAARRFILHSVRPYVDDALLSQHQDNHKSHLQQYAQRHWNCTPEYTLLDEKGPDHDKCFEVAVSINGQYFPSAWGRNKKEAEQQAARRALIALGEEAETEDGFAEESGVEEWWDA